MNVYAKSARIITRKLPVLFGCALLIAMRLDAAVSGVWAVGDGEKIYRYETGNDSGAGTTSGTEKK